MNYFPTQYQEFIYTRTYSRFLPEKNRRENWGETVQRYSDFFENRIPEEHLPAWREATKAILNFEVMPSMRALWSAGEALARESAAAFNCSYLQLSRIEAFSEMLYLLMNGAGVGFSVERQYISNLPNIPDKLEKIEDTITVADSKEGWAIAFNELITALYGGKIPNVNYDLIRPEGAPLRTFGGRSSGRQPLIDLFKFTINTFQNAVGRKLTSIEAHDIACYICQCVVVGGVRRCLPKGALVHTKKGLKKIEDVKVGDKVLSYNNSYKKVLASEDVGIKKTVFIKTQMGSFECTPEHRIAVLTDTDGNIKWVEAKDLKEKDYLVFSRKALKGQETSLPSFQYERPKHSTTCKDINVPAFDSDMAWLFGYLHGNGCIHNDRGSVSFACPYNYPELHLRVVAQMKRFGINVDENYQSDEACSKPRTKSKQLNVFLKQFKQPHTSIEIPKFILEGTVEIRASYLAGLFDADGSLKGRPLDMVSTVYPDFLRQVQAMLSSLGIVSYESFRREARGNWKSLHNLSIKGTRNVALFDEIVGIYSSKVAQDGIASVGCNNAYIVPKAFFKNEKEKLKTSPYYHIYKNSANINMSWDKFEQLFGEQGFVPIEVKEVVSSGEKKHCFDLQVEDTESFFCEGLLVHNSASISLSNRSDDRMAHAKDGAYWETAPYRSNANNSIAYTEKPTCEQFLDDWLDLKRSNSGERGIFNRESAEFIVGRTGRRKVVSDLGCNPCSEIILRDQEMCNLSEVVVRSDDTLKELKDKVRKATIIGCLQATLLDFKFISSKWVENMKEERLLGVSLTGLRDHKILGQVSDEAKVWLTDMKNVAIQTAQEWSSILEINMPAAITCTKPSGSVSQLVNSASGLHTRPFKYYIRRVRISTNDPLFKMLKDKGLPWSPENDQDEENCNTAVFAFPIKSPEGAITNTDVNALEQLEYWLMLQQYWCEHKPSVTINVAENEWIEVANWLYNHWRWVSGLSFLPKSNVIYRQAPQEEIDENTYLEMLKDVPNIDFSELPKWEVEDATEGSREYACAGGACELG